MFMHDKCKCKQVYKFTLDYNVNSLIGTSNHLVKHSVNQELFSIHRWSAVEMVSFS